MDDETLNLLWKLQLHGVEVIESRDFETSAMIDQKQKRSRAEYSWTMTPFLFEAVFERDPELEMVTYLDADLWFLSSPDRILADFRASSADVLITSHSYHPAFDASETSGKYCVQFLVAKRDSSRDVLRRWQEQCLDWCFAYSENGRFGDQGYLTEWPQLYGSRVKVVEGAEFQGPWNALRFPYSEAVAFHFHSYLHFGRGRFSVGFYPIPFPHRKYCYQRYAIDLSEAERRIESVGFRVRGRAGILNRLRAFRARVLKALSALPVP